MKILLITYNFLEFYNANSIQARKFFLELANRDIQITVLTKSKSKGEEMVVDHNNIKVYKIFSINPKFFNKIPNILNIHELNFMPDWNLFLWNPFVLLKLKNLIKNESFDIIHTISSPSSTHLIPFFLNKKPNTKWVAQFYDPWVDNSYLNLRFNFFSILNLNLEKKVAVDSDLIIHTNKYIQEKWDLRYGIDFVKNKLILPLSLNKIENNKLKLSDTLKNEKIIISHIGSIYGKRNLNAFIFVLFNLIESGKVAIDQITIKLVGSLLERGVKEKIEALSFGYIFELIGEVSYSESLKYMETSSLLLLIEEEGKESLFFPSKLTDYLVQNKPILGILPDKCISKDILLMNGHNCFEHTDTKGISLFLEDFVKSTHESTRPLNSNISDLYVENVVNKYLEKISNIK